MKKHWTLFFSVIVFLATCMLVNMLVHDKYIKWNFGAIASIGFVVVFGLASTIAGLMIWNVERRVIN